jgi:hypothetical protein
MVIGVTPGTPGSLWSSSASRLYRRYTGVHVVLSTCSAYWQACQLGGVERPAVPTLRLAGVQMTGPHSMFRIKLSLLVECYTATSSRALLYRWSRCACQVGMWHWDGLVHAHMPACREDQPGVDFAAGDVMASGVTGANMFVCTRGYMCRPAGVQLQTSSLAMHGQQGNKNSCQLSNSEVQAQILCGAGACVCGEDWTDGHAPGHVS